MFATSHAQLEWTSMVKQEKLEQDSNVNVVKKEGFYFDLKIFEFLTP